MQLATVGGKATASIPNGIETFAAAVSSFLVLPTSVAVGSGSKTVAPLGTVTFTGASTVTVNGCFTSTYDNYHIVLNVPTTSTSLLLTMQFTLAGAAVTTLNYDAQVSTTTGTTVAAAQTLAAANWQISGNALPIHSLTIEMFGPALTQATTAIVDTLSTANPMTASAFWTKKGALHRLATAYDGLMLTASTGTMTGTISVFGWNKG